MVTYNDGDDLAAMIVLSDSRRRKAFTIVAVCPARESIIGYQVVTDTAASAIGGVGIGQVK